MLRAAGVLIRTGDRVLLLKRSPAGDSPGTWAFPGGKIEKGELPADAASRECFEETEYILDPKTLTDFARRQANDVDYTTFLAKIKSPFVPDLNEEHEDYAWATIGGPYPEPLHPGAAIALAKLKWNELDIARAIRDGDLTSPQLYENIALFAIRITGTGASHRQAHNEYVWRDPKIYLNDDFLARCNGLPVICEHPEGSKLTSLEFQDRIVGTILLAYIKGTEVWGIAKIYDDAAIDMMSRYQLSTSPSVLFTDPGPEHAKYKLKSGDTILVEGAPNLLDHIAIVPDGVWDKRKGPSGVDTTFPHKDEIMTAEEEKALAAADRAKADKARKDAEEKARKDSEEASDLKKLLAMCDSINSRMDSFGSRMDAFEKGRKDAETRGPGDEGSGGVNMTKTTVAGTPEAVAADKARKDAEEEEAKKREEEERMKADKARKDAEEKEKEEIRTKIADMDSRIPADMTEKDYADMQEAQADADRVASVFGHRAPPVLRAESIQAYRVRMARKYQEHSPVWKDVDLSTLPKDAQNIAVQAVYADAVKAGMSPATVPAGQLREHVQTDAAGRRISTFYGSPRAWMQDFRSPPQYLVGINKEG